MATRSGGWVRLRTPGPGAVTRSWIRAPSIRGSGDGTTATQPLSVFASLDSDGLERELEVRRDRVHQAETEIQGKLNEIRKISEKLAELLNQAITIRIELEAANIRQPNGDEAKSKNQALEKLIKDWDRWKAELATQKAQAQVIVDTRLAAASNQMAEVLTEMRRRRERSRIEQALDEVSKMILENAPRLVRRR